MRIALAWYVVLVWSVGTCEWCQAEAIAAGKYHQALQLYWAEKNVAAFAAFIEVAAEQPESPEARRATYMATIILEQKLTPDEYRALKETLAQRHEYLVRYISAYEARKKGENAAALRAFVQFVAESPNDGWRLFGLQALCGTRWEWNDAKVDVPTLEKFFAEAQRLEFEGCTELWPMLAQPLLNAYSRSKDCKKQTALLRFIYDLRQNPGAMQQILQCYISEGNEEEATKFVDEAIKLRPDDPYTYTSLAYAFSGQRKYEPAIALLRRGFKALGPKEPDLVVTLATMYEQQMDLARALDVLQKSGPPYASQVSQKLDQLKERLPEKYMPVWASPVSNIVNVAVGKDDLLYALVRGQPWKVVQIDKEGRAAEEIDIRSENDLRSGFFGFDVYPDGTFQIQNRHIDRRGELVRKLDMGYSVFRLFVSNFSDVFAVVLSRGLYRFDAEGKALLDGVDKENLDPHAMGVVASEDGIIVANKMQLVLYDMDGRRVKTVGKAGNQPGEFRDIYDIEIDHEGLLYVADTNNGRIQVFDRNLNFLTKIPGPWSKYVEVDSAGNVYVEQGDRVAKYAPRVGGARGMVKSPQPK